MNSLMLYLLKNIPQFLLFSCSSLCTDSASLADIPKDFLPQKIPSLRLVFLPAILTSCVKLFLKTAAPIFCLPVWMLSYCTHFCFTKVEFQVHSLVVRFYDEQESQIQRLEIKTLSQLFLKVQLSNDLQVSQVFVLLILNSVIFSKLFIKIIFLSRFSL